MEWLNSGVTDTKAYENARNVVRQATYYYEPKCKMQQKTLIT